MNLKIISLFLIIGLIFSLGLDLQLFPSNSLNQMREKADAVVIDKHDVHYLKFHKDEAGTPVSVEQLGLEDRPEGGGFAYRTDSFIKLGSSYYAKSTTYGKQKVSLVKIDTKAWNWKYMVYDQGEPYAFTAGERGVYASSIGREGFEISHYDSNLELIKKKWFDYPGGVVNPRKALEVEDGLLFLLALIPMDAPYGVNPLHLWRLDKDLNLIEDIDLGFDLGSSVAMAYFDDVLYLSNVIYGENSVSGEDIGAKRIFMINLKERELPYPELTLDTPYPSSISLDEKRNILIVGHDANRLGYDAWTLIDLVDGSQSIIDDATLGLIMDSQSAQPDREKVQAKGRMRDKPNKPQSAFLDRPLTVHHGLYYILFDHYIAVYNPDTGGSNLIDLRDCGIEEAHSLILLK